MKSTVLPLAAIFIGIAFAQTPSGAEVYKTRCALCHDNESAHAPSMSSLKTMTPARIINTLDFGVMMSVTSMLSRAERDAVANYLGTPRDDRKIPANAFCKDRAVAIANDPKVSWNGWSPSLSNARFQPVSGLTLDQVRSLKLKWAFGYEGDVNSFSPPAILDGQLFVGSASGLVHALDAKSGCIKWQYQASGPVRTAMLIAPNGSKHSLLFGDQTGLFYAVEAEKRQASLAASARDS